MSKLVPRRPASWQPTEAAVLRDVCGPLSECLKESLHQLLIRAKDSGVDLSQTQLQYEDAEVVQLRRRVADTKDKIRRTDEERQRVLAERDRLAVDLQEMLKTVDYSQQRNFNKLLQASVATHMESQDALQTHVEKLRHALEEKRKLLQVRDNEVRMMKKELEKSALQRSLLLGRINSDKPPARPLVKVASKSQADCKSPATRGIEKASIKPFTSFTFSLNIFQSKPVQVPLGHGTPRTPSSKGESTPSKQSASVKNFVE